MLSVAAARRGPIGHECGYRIIISGGSARRVPACGGVRVDERRRVPGRLTRVRGEATNDDGRTAPFVA